MLLLLLLLPGLACASPAPPASPVPGASPETTPGIYVTSEPGDVAALAGSSALLACAASTSANRAMQQQEALDVRYSWRFAPVGEHEADLLLDGDNNRRQLSNGSLVLTRMSAALAGQYRCVVTGDGVGTVVSRAAIVSLVELPPLLEGSPEWARRSVAVSTGSAVLLGCSAAAGSPRVAHRVLGATAGADRRVYGVAQHAPAVPTVDVNVAWLKNGVLLQLAPARMSLTPSGALEIDPTQQHDAAIYRCNVSLAQAPHIYRLGPEMELQLTADSELAETAPRFIAMPQPLTVMEGSAVTFDCAAVGSPRPEMIWLNNGVAIDLNDLDSRFYLVGGGSLRVLSVRALDAGGYTCRAHNRHDSADLTTHLSVLTPPRVTKVLRAVSARARGDAELPCDVRGRPAPTVQWLKDGEPLTPNHHDITLVNGNTLRIQGVLTVDAGMFQCVASSVAGSAQAATRLVVLPATDEAPKKVQKGKPKAKMKTASKQNYTKTDKPVNPKSFLNSLISSDGTDVPFLLQDIKVKQSASDTNKLPNSHHIFTSLLSDQDGNTPPGTDLDSADDFLGETSSAFTPGPDLDLDPHAGSNYSDYDYDSPERLDSDYDPVSRSTPAVSERDIDVNLLTSDDTAANPGLDVDSGDNLDVNGTDAPPAPHGLRAVIVKHRFVTLSWEQGEGSEGPAEGAGAPGGLTAYAVLYKVKGSVRERVLKSSRAVQEMNVPSLQPDTTYQFRVVAYSQHAASAPSEWIEVHTPAEEWTWGPPREVRVAGVSPAALRVSWSSPAAVAPATPGSHVDKYRLQWTEVESGREQWAYSAPDATEHLITGLRAATLYAVRVSAAGGAPSAEMRARTLQDAPDAPPGNVTASPHTSTSVLVRWEAPPARSHRGLLTGYKVRYRLATPSPRRRADSLTTPADARRAELKGLERATAYQVRVCALNANGSGPFSEWVTVLTAPQELDESRVPAEPGPLRTRAGRDWISVWWSAAGEGAGEERTEGPAVRVRNYSLAWGLGVPDEHSHVLPDDARSHVIRELVSNSEYVISLRATNALGSGPPVYATVRTRPELAEGDEEEDDEEGAEARGEGGEGEEDEEGPEPESLIPPVGLKVIMLSGTTAVVYWTDTTLPKGQTATDGRRYGVRWSPTGGAAGGRTRHLNVTDLNCMLDELRPHTVYEFSVKLYRGGRESAWSMVVTNTTLEAAPGSAPRDLQVSPAAPAGRTADLVWAPPAKPNGVITGYVIMYSAEARRTERDWVAAAVLGDRRTARVDRLRPRTTYHFKLQARNAKGLGPFSQPVVYTTPDESAGAGGVGGAGSSGGAWLWACAGGACAVLVVAAALALSLCCRRSHPPLSPDRSTYQKSSASAGIKPPDLWIHHDQMELKQLDKSHHGSSISAGSADNANALISSTLTLGRGAPSVDYEPAARHHAPTAGSVDRRHYVPTYVDSLGTHPPAPASCASDDTAVLRACSVASASSSGVSARRYDPYDCKPMSSVGGCAAACERGALGYARPPHPRPLHMHPDQSTPLLAGGVLGSPQSSLGSLGPHHPSSVPCAVASCPLGVSCGASPSVLGAAGCPGTLGSGAPGDVYAVASRERERGHYVAYEPLGHYTHRDSISEAGAGGAGGGSLQRRPGGGGGGAAPGAGAAGLHSFTLPAGASVTEPGSSAHSTHSTPTHGKVTIRANTSPYKKSGMSGSPASGPPASSGSPGHIPNRLQLGPAVQHSADELETLTPGRGDQGGSTERLQREMANLEGLMKDLCTITQQQFQC